MKKAIKTIEATSLYDKVSEKIFSGEYPPGYRLIEAELAECYGVSRTPVRIAIERLVSEGLAEHVANRGATVRQLSLEDIRSLFKIREVNEGLVARLACQNVFPEDKQIFDDFLERAHSALENDDLILYYELSNKIHKHIRDMAKNEFLTEFLNKIYSIAYRYNINIMLLPGRAQNSLQEHHKIIDCILSRDEDGAEKAMIEHVKTISSFYNDERNRGFFHSLNSLKKS